jgi:hypothetical protein
VVALGNYITNQNNDFKELPNDMVNVAGKSQATPSIA